MPLWSYTCRGCKATSDYIRRSENRDNPAYCTNCLSWSSRRIMTAPGLIGETVVRAQQSPEPMPCGCLWARDRVDAEQAETFDRIEAEEAADASPE